MQLPPRKPFAWQPWQNSTNGLLRQRPRLLMAAKTWATTSSTESSFSSCS